MPTLPERTEKAEGADQVLLGRRAMTTPEPPAPARYMPPRKPEKIARPLALAMMAGEIFFLSMVWLGKRWGVVGPVKTDR